MSNITSLILYLSCFLLSTGLLTIGIRESSRALRAVAIVIPILLTGLRYDVGTDYSSYEMVFRRFSEMSLSEMMSQPLGGGIEISFFGLIKLSSILTTNAWLMFFISTAITLGVAYAAIRRLSPESTPITFLLYLLIILPFTLNGVRQGIAVSIIFFAYTYIVRGNLFKYILTVLLAATFHTSAVVILPLYLLRFITIKKRTDAPFTLLLSIAVAVATVLLIPLILLTVSALPVLSVYIRYEGWETGIAWSTLLLLSAFVPIVIATYQRLTLRLPSLQLMTILLFLEISAMFLGGISAAFSRMSFYMSVGGLVYMSNIPTIFNSKSKRLLQFLIIIYGLLYFVNFYFLNGYSNIFPYLSIWSGK